MACPLRGAGAGLSATSSLVTIVRSLSRAEPREAFRYYPSRGLCALNCSLSFSERVWLLLRGFILTAASWIYPDWSDSGTSWIYPDRSVRTFCPPEKWEKHCCGRKLISRSYWWLNKDIRHGVTYINMLAVIPLERKSHPTKWTKFCKLWCEKTNDKRTRFYNR